MGILADRELRRQEASAWEPALVGAAPPFGGKGTATLIRAEGVQWEYADEVDIEFRLGELESVALPDGEEELFWSGIEIRIDKRELSKFLTERGLPDPGTAPYFITAALTPRSFLWYGQARLRPGFGEQERRDQGLKQFAGGETSLAALPFDPFERDPDFLVARLGDPRRPQWQEGVQEAGDGFLVDRNPNRRSATARVWNFGLCAGVPEDAAQALVQKQWDEPRTMEARIPRLRNGGDSRPESELETIFKAGVRQALGGRAAGSQRTLKGETWRNIRELYLDVAQRRGLTTEGKRAVGRTMADRAMTEPIRAGAPTRADIDEVVEKSWKAHLREHPKCMLFDKKKCLTFKEFAKAQATPGELERLSCWTAFEDAVNDAVKRLIQAE